MFSVLIPVVDQLADVYVVIMHLSISGRGDTALVVQETFSLRMREMMVCPGCSRSWPNPPHDYDTHVFYVHVRALKDVAAKAGKRHVGGKQSSGLALDALLQTAGKGDLYSCQNIESCSMARRGEKRAGHRYLLSGPPQVFSLGLVWDTLRVDQEDVKSVLQLIEPTLSLKAFRLPSRGAAEMPQAVPCAELRAFFCFHPQKHHYVA